jgi:sialate O-acetylesterase
LGSSTQHGAALQPNHGQKKEVLTADNDLAVSVSRFDSLVKAYPEALAKYNASLDAWKLDSVNLPKPRPILRPNNDKAPYRLYNAMIAPLKPYTLRGVIWYQGESNADRAYNYRKLFPAMIANWRDDFQNKKLPFYFVQISPHRGQNAEIRDAQLYALRTVPYTGMAVTTDNGDSLDIHPRNKKLVGERLSVWALHNEYGKKDIEVSGPLYSSMKIDGNKIRIRFDHVDGGLEARDGALKEFTIAGDDQAFVPANASIEGNEVVVWSEQVAKPVAVRFAWKNIPRPNFYNKSGLPASPFRTDSWKLTTQGKN